MNDGYQSKHCKFCRGNAILTRNADMEIDDTQLYFCAICQVEYLYWEYNTLINQSLYTMINNKLYKWTTIPSLKIGNLFYVQYDPVDYTWKKQFIKSFDMNQMEITPSNINNKLRTYLILL